MDEDSVNGDKAGNITKRILFNNRTFNSKLFLKLTGSIIEPSIRCIQTLRYESQNRKPFEIESAIVWLQTFPALMKFINLEETANSSKKLLIELTWYLFYKYHKKNLILRKAAENNEFFYILLAGKILKLTIIFEKVSLTLEEYLIYLFKLKIVHEKEIIKKCRVLNNFIVDIDGENLHKFCQSNPQFNYEKLKEKAKQELINLGFQLEDFHEDKHIINNSVENFLKIAKVKKNLKSFNDGIKATPKFYIGRYEKAGYITKGQSIGNLTRDIHDDNSTYICLDNCDIVHINKKAARMRTLYNLIIEKKKRVLSNLKNNFLIFNLVNEKFFNDEIIPFFEYKQFHKGDKIFIQGSTYEGIYLITEGEVEIYLNSSVNDIGNCILNVKNSLNSLNEYYSDINEIDDSGENGEPVKPKIVRDKENLDTEKAELLNKIQKFSLLKISKKSIFGTNELYDYKTGLFFFSAECISKEATIYFLPKKFFYASFVREKPIYLSLAKMVEFRVKDMIGRLKNHVISFDKYMDKKYKNTFNKKTLINNKNSFMKSLKFIKRRNINENVTTLTKRSEELPFPLLLKEKNISLIKDYNNRNAPIRTFSNTVRENIHISLRDKVFSQYKKIKKITSHQKPNKIVNKYNNKTNVEGRRLNISVKKNNIINNFNVNLPSNFPFNVQNSYYNSTPRKRIQNYSLLNHIILNCK